MGSKTRLKELLCEYHDISKPVDVGTKATLDKLVRDGVLGYDSDEDRYYSLGSE